MKVNGLTTKPMELEHTPTLMEPSTSENGKMISRMERELRSGWTGKDMKANMKKGQRLERACSLFWMVAIMKVNFSITKFTDKV